MITRMLAALVSVGILLAVSSSASAHPSDPDTLTIDLLVDARGVVLIDAAGNPGENTIEAALPQRERRRVAHTVLEALRVPRRLALVDSATSDRYHEVGFRIYVLPGTTPPRAPGTDPRRLVALSSDPLQRVAERFSMERLKLSICPVTDRLGPIIALDVRASRDGEPAATALEREACTTWNLATSGDSITYFVKIDASSLGP